MKINNIRYGFACNSSSLHSILRLHRGHKIADRDIPDDNRYNWEEFVLASKEAKLGYLGAILTKSFPTGAPDYLCKAVFEKYTKDVPVEYPVVLHEDAMIDHQSVIHIPKQYGTSFPDIEFFKEMRDYLLDEGLVIFGGNDQGEATISDIFEDITDQLDKDNPAALNVLQGSEYDYCRKDPKYGYWSLFSHKDGTKLRFSFKDNVDMTKASLPELVDLKITDYCAEGCKYCYQSSSITGKHADWNKVNRVIHALADLRVWEVALGGGEVTHYPHFTEVLRECRESGIVPNFTTRNLKWFKVSANVDAFKQYAGRVAFSIGNLYQVREIEAMAKWLDIEKKVSVQCIDGIDDWTDIVKYSTLPVTVLGYKHVGRGANCEPYRMDSFKAAYDSAAHCVDSIGVDTAFLAKHLDEIKELEIPEEFYTLNEGQYSMYIDAVRCAMAPSSYSSQGWVPLDLTVHDIAETIQEWFERTSQLTAEAV